MGVGSAAVPGVAIQDTIPAHASQNKTCPHGTWPFVLMVIIESQHVRQHQGGEEFHDRAPDLVPEEKYIGRRPTECLSVPEKDEAVEFTVRPDQDH
jgi:hypothetical protein